LARVDRGHPLGPVGLVAASAVLVARPARLRFPNPTTLIAAVTCIWIRQLAIERGERRGAA
jgi:hypothetical protein